MSAFPPPPREHPPFSTIHRSAAPPLTRNRRNENGGPTTRGGCPIARITTLRTLSICFLCVTCRAGESGAHNPRNLTAAVVPISFPAHHQPSDSSNRERESNISAHCRAASSDGPDEPTVGGRTIRAGGPKCLDGRELDQIDVPSPFRGVTGAFHGGNLRKRRP
ncbi:hypothetical protein MUK42_03662 [Musa troglodytarum]|uniref:Uncharacterized protein n=1 Tax=Musa troglodytarum TaxID=320322 RepID=A0A9E7GRL7_9LILI|nr:hypothetical protein MUK42_03662 [Musa troglodytarum]